MNAIDSIILLLLYLIPLYVSNSIPVIIHGKTPLDLNTKLFGKPLFGKGKTVIGTLAGLTAGTLSGAVITIFFPYSIALVTDYFGLAMFLSIGAILGDLVKSFFKRRFGIKSGEKWELADQWDFILGGIIISAFFRLPELWLVTILLIATFFIHKAANFLAYSIKIKEVPW
jgi:CDP-2,3-bis-(O-geranylgeranyl)-sn-glycerol synthase